MLEIVKTIFMILGAYVFGVFIYATVRVSINRFNRWRKNGCKIKCLCKPHIYDFYWFFPDSGELALKCKKCRKIKKIIVDRESFNSGMWN